MSELKDGVKTITKYLGKKMEEKSKEQPKRKPQFKLAIVTSVRMTENEWETLVQKADQSEMKPSALIRQCVKCQLEV